MGEFNPTPAQRAAVELSGQTMLVSAAAGSGKTAVLTKRIIRLITDSDNPVNVSDLLVVTFTKAAASELKERISKAIYEALKKDPLNKHLSNQLLQLGKARICTIHSFCGELVKSNFQSLGLPANLRVADESESTLICNNIMNELIEECYGGLHTEKITDFIGFSELFLQSKKDDALPFKFFKIYRYLLNYPLGIDLLLKYADELEDGAKGDPLDTRWGKKVKDNIKIFCEYSYPKFVRACDHMLKDPLLKEKYYPSFEFDRNFLFDLLSNIDNYSYNDLFTRLSSLERVKMLRIPEKDLSDKDIEYKNMRKTLNDLYTRRVKSLFTFKESTLQKHFKDTAAVCRDMYGFLNLFDRRYKEEKKNRGILDYNDLETYAIRLLYDDKECKISSALSKSVKDRFKYIFIDEYQDVNELQDKVFSGICTENNRFMVGDIKQSIYGFRGAEPSLFSDYRNKFPTCDPENKVYPEGDAVTLYLSTNFRSDRSVLDFSNAVFKVLFNNNSGKIPYTEGDELVYPDLNKTDEKDYTVRMCFVDDESDSSSDSEADEESGAFDDEEFEEVQDVKSIQAEAEFVADEIVKLKNQNLDVSKVAILLRSKGNAVYFEEALKKRKIESFNREDRDFFENDAVLLMLCVLNTIDNPSRDIYLTGTLKSPLFGFTLSEITEIRLSFEDGTLFSALKRYEKATGNQKCRYFIDKLNEWREYSVGCPVDKLVRYIYNQTHIVELLAGKKNKESDIERQANLLLLYEYARNFENGSFKGLYNFILYLDDVLAKRTQLGNARLTSEGENVVNIMTVHNSKGLEFDTVFYSDTGHNFNRMDENSAYIMHKDFGFTVKLKDVTNFGKFDTLPRQAAKIALREEVMDEEMRVLYVALTRAKKRLIITSSMKNPRKFIEEVSSDESTVSRYVLLNTKNMSELLLWGIIKSGYKDYAIEYIPLLSNVSEDEKETDNVTVIDQKEVDSYFKAIEDNLSFSHPYSELSSLPAKLAVSKLYPGVLDEYTTEVESVAPSMYLMPKFMSGTELKANAAEKGTATHLFMQFCDFENVLQKGVQAELSRMLDKGFIDKRNAGLVNLEKVENFFKSEMFESLQKARQIWRERRFNISLPAARFTEDAVLKVKYKDENVLVQGVIDLLYLDENGKLILADYKTDWFSESQISSGDAECILKNRHKTQLSYYAEACKRMFGKDVDEILIYSFALDKAVKL